MTAETKTLELTLTRTIPANPAEVYDAWMDPANPGSVWHGVQKLTIQPKPNGLFFLVHRTDSGKDVPHYGRFLALERAQRMQHTWMSEYTRGMESLVTVSFEKQGQDTLLTLRHTGLPDEEALRGHERGWNHFLGAFFGAEMKKRA